MQFKPFFDKFELELQNQIGHEGAFRCSSTKQFLQTAGPDDIPLSWREAIHASSVKSLVQNLWLPTIDVLPNFYRELVAKIWTIALLNTESNGLSVLYFFRSGDDMYVRRGFSPAALPDVVKSFAVDLSCVYAIHNGWVNFYSLDGGPLPITVWPRLGKSPNEFLGVLSDGPNILGFDLSQTPAHPHMISPDSEQKIDVIDDFWAYLDNYLSESLGFMDSVNEPLAVL